MDLHRSMQITSEDIYEDMCKKIEKLEYMPGQGISENELCKQYNVSRHMVRGALTRLKQRRLIDVYPQKGTFVSLIDMDYISDILYLREAIEQEALQRVVQLEDVSDLCERLEANIALQKECSCEGGYSDDFYQLDTEFHGFILQEIKRANVNNLIEEPYIHIRRWRNFEIRSADRMYQLINEHESIVDAIKAKDAVQARAAMHTHLDTVKRYGESFKEIEKYYFF
ncbi:GntR family transcriptional regulator [Konateibacter massiliensis]|uniref:GntR family transcriptional regulator n=1 Tax=Konateibacter massiliensis TaxID=2002841 RepID=UPI000C15D534|nr:GntR family transcriptional regulator [Konateibacter massiliensis]